MVNALIFRSLAAGVRFANRCGVERANVFVLEEKFLSGSTPDERHWHAARIRPSKVHRVWSFCGIARPRRFLGSCAKLEWSPPWRFPSDHHAYNRKDVLDLLAIREGRIARIRYHRVKM